MFGEARGEEPARRDVAGRLVARVPGPACPTGARSPMLPPPESAERAPRRPWPSSRHDGIECIDRSSGARTIPADRLSRSAVKLLVVAPEPVFTPRGTPFSVYHRLAAASELGVEADLLTYDEGTDPDLPGLRVHRIPRIPFLGPVRIGPSLGKLVRDVVMVLHTIVLVARRRPDIVHAHEEAIFWCRALKPIFGFRLIYDMHSSLPQQLTNFEFTSSRLLIGAFEWLEKSALNGSDIVLTISPAVADVALSRMNDPGRHVMLENSILDLVRLKGDPVAGARLSREVKEQAADAWPDAWSDSSVVLYAGTIEPYQGIDLLLEAFAVVVRSRPDARLAVVGGTEEQVEQYRAQARELGLERVTRFAGSVSQAVARELIARVGVLVSPRTVGSNTPLKVYELLASGVPFAATRVEAHTQVLDDTVCVLADPEPDAFAEAILTALNGGPAVEARVAAARRLYEERYSHEAYRLKLGQVLERLAPEARPGPAGSGDVS